MKKMILACLVLIGLLKVSTADAAEITSINKEPDKVTINYTTDKGSERTTIIDMSEASFYDEKGNIVEKPNFQYSVPDITEHNGEVKLSLKHYHPEFRSVSPRRTSGSGYVNFIGAKVSHYHQNVWVNFNADFTFVKGGGDILESV